METPAPQLLALAAAGVSARPMVAPLASPIPLGSDSPVAKDGTTVGKWTPEENAAFETGLSEWGRDWKRIQKTLPARTITQIRTHAR